VLIMLVSLFCNRFLEGPYEGDPRGPLARPLLPLVGYHRVRVGAVTLACVPFPACVSGAHVGHPACLSVSDRVSCCAL
jgi:hypothetical protein